MAGSSAEKSERPTPRRLREARRKGQIPVGRDLIASASFAAAVAALALGFHWLAASVRGLLVDAIGRATSTPRFELPDAIGSLDDAMWRVAWATVPVAGSAVAAGVLAGALQTACALSASSLAPKAERLDPVAGVKRLFALRTGVELAKTWSKLLLVAVAVATAVYGHRNALLGWLASGGDGALAVVLEIAKSAAFRSAFLLLGAGAADILVQHRLHERELRMTKDEVRRDHKDEEGDPHIRNARKQAHREIATHRMTEATRTASFVAVNPTHLATAVLYDETKDEAPRVVAKGSGDVARRIRRAAESAGVRVVYDKPLARALFRVPLDGEIPESLYTAVAEVLAYVRERDE